MIQPAFLALLAPAIRGSQLTTAGLPAAVLAAVAMAAITMGTDEEEGAAPLLATGPEQENAFVVDRSRHCGLAVLDSGGLFVSG